MLFQAMELSTIQLISFNECSSDTTSREISLSVIPNAQFSVDQSEGCHPFTVQYSDQSTGTINDRLWEFPGGNPATSSATNPTVNYDQAGIYPAKLTVRNESNQDSLILENLIIVNESTVAQFDYDPIELKVAFDNQSGAADTYLWDFGDGMTSNELSPSHIYDTSGVYLVQLITQNSCSTDTTTLEVIVNEALRANFQTDKLGGCSPTIIQFTDQSTGAINSRLWEFPGGNPATSTELQPIVEYNTPGEYNVKLTVSNDEESQSTTVENAILVRDLPIPAFDFEPSGQTIQFKNLSQGATRYSWSFGDGVQSNDFEPEHIYKSEGNYTVTLNAQNEFCGQATSQQIMITLTDLEDQLALHYIKLFPNPAKDWIVIEHNLKQSPLVIEIYNTQGQNLVKQTINDKRKKIALTSLLPGQYIFRIQHEDRQWSHSIIKH